MSFLGKLFTLFPSVNLLLIASSFIIFCVSANPWYFFAFLFSVYLFPLFCFRILIFFFPIKEGVTNILSSHFSPWWAGHQIQLLFIAVPFLEALLRLIPGCYSLWLRCWGSSIGKAVYWTPGVCNYDRNLLEVGDHVVFGERSLTVCHVITPKGDKALLNVAKVRVGNQAFIGAACVISPGVTMDDKAFVKAGVRVYPMSFVDIDGVIKAKCDV